jgi:DNA primase
MIPQSFIQELLNRLDIVEVVERYVPLKKAGANYQACCPFHTEKTPSFSVSPTKQFYHCFGCGAHGSAIGFVMEHQGLSYVEAIKELAQSVGMTVPEQPGPRRNQGDEEDGDLTDWLAQAARYYKEQLKGSAKAIAYLKGRGVTGETARRFGIGYAPDGWQNLQAVFPDYQHRALVKSGLLIASDEGRRYDRFRDRVMFPILNARGSVIGFGGRVLGAGEPKYLNSPETPVFEKGRELYGLFQARNAIRAGNRVMVVEGYMDVVMLHQHGVEYAVATLGTATTPFHVQKLLRQADEVVFCFDGDAAGRKAAWRALENSLEAVSDGKRLSFLFLPEGEDPDTYVQKIGQEAFEAAVKGARPLSEFLLGELVQRADVRTEEGRAGLVEMARPLLGRIKAPTLSLLLRKKLAEKAGMTPAELDSIVKPEKPSPAPRTGRPALRQAPAQTGLTRQLLRAVLMRPDLTQRIDAELLHREDRYLAALAALAGYCTENGDMPPAAHLLEHFRDTPHYPVLLEAQQALEQGVMDDSFDVESDFAAAQGKLLKSLQDERLEELKKKGRLTREEAEELNRLALRRS